MTYEERLPHTRPIQQPARAASFACRLAAACVAAISFGCGGSSAGSTATGTTAANAPSAGTAYEIRMHRPATVGRRGRIVAAAEKRQHMQVRANPQTVRESREDLRVRFRAIERVVSLDSHGKPLGSEYTIERFETEGANGPEAMIPPGQIVTLTRARRAAQAQVILGGQPVAAPVRAALDAVLSFSSDGATDDDIFGTSERQPAGARWPVHGDVAARDLAAISEIQTTITGETRAGQRSTFQGVDCLEMSGQLDGTLTALPNLPPGSVIRVGTMSIAYHGMFPIVTSLPVLSGTTRMRMHIVVDFQASGQAAELEMNGEDQKDETFTLL